jgi:hypothetical protein
MDRFAIVQAHYWHAANNHNGQSSYLYAKLSRIGRYYRPGLMERGPDDTAQPIYVKLADVSPAMRRKIDSQNRRH